MTEYVTFLIKPTNFSLKDTKLDKTYPCFKGPVREVQKRISEYSIV